MAVERGVVPPGDGSDDTALLVQRLRFLLLLSPVPVLLFALADVYLAHPEKVAALFGMTVAAMLIAAAAFVALGAVRRRAAISAIGLAGIGALYLRNAIEAPGDVGDRREVRVVSRRLAGDALELSVRDTGPGLPPSAADRVFDAFFSTKNGGLGMGLSISRTIVEAHHGRLSAVPHAEGGAMFRLVLPIAEAPLAAASGAR